MLPRWLYLKYIIFQECLESSLSTTVLDNIFAKTIDVLLTSSTINSGGARNHDILAACMTMLITHRTVKLILPSCLRTNEQIRLYALSTVLNNLGNRNDLPHQENHLQQISFKCYDGGTLFYISENEKNSFNFRNSIFLLVVNTNPCTFIGVNMNFTRMCEWMWCLDFCILYGILLVCYFAAKKCPMDWNVLG